MKAPSLSLKGYLVLGGLALSAWVIYEIVNHPDWFNPASQNNLANRGFNSLYQDVTGSKGTLGTDIYNWLHPGQAPSTGPAVPMCFQRDANGSLVYINGVIQQVPCSQNPPGYQTP